MIKSLLTEYKLPWVINRTLYSSKLKFLKKSKILENSFEKKVEVKRILMMDIDISKIEEFLSMLPNTKKNEILKVADNALRGKVKGFNSIELDYGHPIQWNFNPITKVYVDKSQKWFDIPDFDSERGDIKVIWEASRFSHFTYFSRAFLITKDSKYYDGFSSQLDDWIRENNYSYGANFKCGQEATIRMLNILIAYSVFNKKNLCNKRDHENVKKIIQTSYQKVLSNFFYADKCIKNNHTLSEICGMIVGSWCCNDTKGLKKAYERMDKEIEKQFSNDGGYIQNSFNYQRFALQITEFILSISRVTNIHLSEKSKEILLKSAYLMYEMQVDEGYLPNRGANDGSLVFQVTTSDYNDFRSIINSISCLVSNEKLFESGHYDEEVIWFTSKRLSEFKLNKKQRVSSSFPTSGLYSLRKNNDTFLMTILKNHQSRPGHMDQLHLDLWHQGVNIFCDSGSFSYSDSIGKELALTAAHNTMKIQRTEQMNKTGAFLITDWSKSKDIEHSSNKFVGTMISKNGYSHTRSILKNDGGYFVSDFVKGNGEYCDFYFHTPCDVIVTKDGFQLFNQGKLICAVVTQGNVRVSKTYRSLYYFKKELINAISIRNSLEKGESEITFEISLF